MTEVKLKKLRNELVICQANQPHLRTMAAAMYIRTGSRYEKAKVRGISHMVEHMLFRGMPRFATTKDHALAVEQLGGSMNAWTSADMVSYHVEAPAESGTEILDLLLEMFQGPRFNHPNDCPINRDDIFAREKSTVLEEIRSRLGAAGQELDPGEVIHRLAYGEHQLGRSIPGTVDSVSSLRYRDLLEHYNSEYVTGNMTLVLTGNLSYTKMSTRRLPTQTGKRKRTDAVKPPKIMPSKVEFVRNQDSAQVDIVAALRAPGLDHKHYLALRVLEQVMYGGMSARVEQQIREPGLAYHTGAQYDVGDDCGLFLVGAGTSPDKVQDLTKGLIDLLSDASYISEDEFHLAKKQVSWNMDLVQDKPLYLADTLGLTANRGKKPDFEKTKASIQNLTLDELHEATRAMVTDRHLYVACIGPVSSANKKHIKNYVKAFAGDNYSEE